MVRSYGSLLTATPRHYRPKSKPTPRRCGNDGVSTSQTFIVCLSKLVYHILRAPYPRACRSATVSVTDRTRLQRHVIASNESTRISLMYNEINAERWQSGRMRLTRKLVTDGRKSPVFS